jgi:CheY-like chemotaxis protein
LKRIILVLCLSFSTFSVASTYGQVTEFYAKPTTPAEYWRALQFEINVGKFEIAAAHLKGFLDSNPTDKDLLELEAKYTLTPFLDLRNVERWSSGKEVEKEARANVETLIKMISAALKNELSNPERIAKFAKNLTGTPEEAAFAIKELTRSGVDAIPVLVDLLRANQAPELRGAILEALPLLDVSTVPPLIASLDAKEVSLKLELLDALRKRRDYQTLSFRVETDLVPSLWRFVAPVASNPEMLRKKAGEMLLGLLDTDPTADRDPEHRLPQWRLTRFASAILDHKARFGASDQIMVWKWDGTKPTGTLMSLSDAQEYYGLRYAGWAIEIQPDFVEAQRVFITLALEKHAGRAGIDVPLANSSPGLYAILATAPYELLNDLLESYLRDERTPLAIWLLNVIGDRHETKSARPSDKPGTSDYRPSLLLKALDYPDRRARFAAVDALLKAPSSPAQQRSSLIVKILAGYLQADATDEVAKPRALIGDVDRVRTEALSAILRQAGFGVESVRTGKELIRRLQEKADVDLIVLDHHTPYPLFSDTLTQLRTDFRTTAIPVLVIASPDHPTTAHPLTLLARLAALVAAEEHVKFEKINKIYEDQRAAAPAHRFKQRLDALRKLVESAGVTVSPDVENRLEYLVDLTTPPGEIDWSVGLQRSRLLLPPEVRTGRMAALQSSPRLGHVSATEAPFANTRELTPALAEVVARYANTLTPEVVELANTYWQIVLFGQQDKEGKFIQAPLPTATIRYPQIEAHLNRLTKPFKLVRVIPEVFSAEMLKDEIKGFFAVQDAKQLETDRKNHAKIAIEWLRKMAIGELPGFPFAEAETSLRQSLHNPELSSAAIDAVARLATREAQQDIGNVVLSDQLPAVRAQAAGALVKHIQQRGLMIRDPQRQLLLDKSVSEADPQVKSRLQDLYGVVQASSKGTGARLLGFTPALPSEPKEKKEAPKDEKKEETKN